MKVVVVDVVVFVVVFVGVVVVVVVVYFPNCKRHTADKYIPRGEQFQVKLQVQLDSP